MISSCPQGGVLTLLLYNMVVDELLDGIEGQGCKAVRYADDLMIIVKAGLP